MKVGPGAVIEGKAGIWTLLGTPKRVIMYGDVRYVVHALYEGKHGAKAVDLVLHPEDVEGGAT